MGDSKDDRKSDELTNERSSPKFEKHYYITTIPGMMQLIQLQLNFICFMRSRSTTDCYFYYHKAGLFWFSLASATGLCMTGLLFLYYSLNLINRSNRLVWIIEAASSFAWASIYSAAVANVVLSTQDYNERTVITPEFCASEDITSMHLVIWINASCRKLLIGGVLAIVAYGVDGTLKCFAFLTMLSLEKEIVATASPPLDLRQFRLLSKSSSTLSKPPRPKPRRTKSYPKESAIPVPRINTTEKHNPSRLNPKEMAMSLPMSVPISMPKELPIPAAKDVPMPVIGNDLPTPMQSPMQSREEISAVLSDALPSLYSRESVHRTVHRSQARDAPPRPHARLSQRSHSHHHIVISPRFEKEKTDKMIP